MSALPETLVARVVGVRKKRLAALRAEKLSRGADWEFVGPTVGVTYSEQGLKKLLALLGVDGAALRWPLEASGAERAADTSPGAPEPATTGIRVSAFEPAATEKISGAVESRVDGLAAGDQARPLVVLSVTKVPRNTRILYARRDPAEGDVVVRVKNNVNFIIGMSLRARAPAAGSEVYSHEGNCPRRRGHY